MFGVHQSNHHTKEKGNLAVIKVILDLTISNYTVFTPAVSEHCAADIVAYDNISGKTISLQVKYSGDGFVKNKTSWADKNGNHGKKYTSNDFDYYGVYLSAVDTVVYVPSSLGGITLRWLTPNSATAIYWYEDFLYMCSNHQKRNKSEFCSEQSPAPKGNKKVTQKAKQTLPNVNKEELQRLVWEKPTQQLTDHFRVSDVAIGKWCKRLGIPKPPRGFWSKTEAEREAIRNVACQRTDSGVLPLNEAGFNAAVEVESTFPEK